MKNVIVAPNPYRDQNFGTAREAMEILKKAGMQVKLCLPFEVDRSYDLPKDLRFTRLDREMQTADLVVCFGGDGTILHMAKSATRRGIPLLGVNIGTMGFMAELESTELDKLVKVARGEYTLDSRMMLDVTVQRERDILFHDICLNDVVVTKGAVARVIDLKVYGDKILICNIFGDGVIVATPTGSTAYSLSAGGPIVEPTAENIILTPISAHTIQAKAMVLDKNRLIDVTVPKQSRKTAYLSVDGGKAFKLFAGDTVQVTRSRRCLCLVRLSDKSFYEKINRKLERRIHS